MKIHELMRVGNSEDKVFECKALSKLKEIISLRRNLVLNERQQDAISTRVEEMSNAEMAKCNYS